MKLLELEIENFGVFRETKHAFDRVFQLIAGPNEAGKSTLLQLIRETFFGFPHQSPYDFDRRSGDMAATASLELRDGRRLRFRRRKGRKDTVAGEFAKKGKPIKDRELAEMLGNASAELYKNVFGFSLAELAIGGDILKQPELKDALFGGGLGSLGSLNSTREAMAKEAAALFKPSGSKPVINQRLAAIKKSKKAVAEATVQPRDYEKQKLAAEELKAAVKTIRQERDSLLKRQLHLKRLEEALPLWQDLQTAHEELDGIAAPEGLPADAWEQFTAARVSRRKLADEIAEATAERDEAAEALKALQQQPEILVAQGQIKTLERKIGMIQQCFRDIPQCRQESEIAKRQVEAAVKHLHPDWDLTHIDRFQTGLAQRHRIDEMQHELEEIEDEQATLATQRSDVEQQFEDQQAELDQLTTVPVNPDLEKLVDRAAVYQNEVEAAENKAAEIDELQGEVARLKKGLCDPLDVELDDPTALPVPLEDTVVKFRDDLADIDQELRDAARREQESADELAEKERELGELAAAASVPDREELSARRTRRDAGWQLIRRRFVEDEKVEDAEVETWLDGAGNSLPDAYENEVGAADKIADERQQKAETVAQREQLLSAIKSQQAKQAGLHGRRTALTEKQQQCIDQWHAAWKNAGFTPLSPEEMLGWLRRHGEFVGKSSQLDKQQTALAQLQHRVAAFERQLAAEVGEETDIAAQLIVARQRVEAARKTAANVERLQTDIQKCAGRLEKLQQQAQTAANRRADWEQRWRVLLADFGFPANWSVKSAKEILQGLADARKDLAAAEELDKRVADMQTEVDRYEAEVAPLVEKVAADLAELPSDEAVTQLAAQLESARQSQQQFDSLSQQCESANKRLTRYQEQQQILDNAVEKLFAAAQVETAEQFEAVAQTARRERELKEQKAGCEEQIRRIARDEDADAFAEMLAETTADDLALERKNLAEELAAVEEKYQTAVGDEREKKVQLESLDRTGEAAALQLELESTRAELAAAVDRYVPLVLADALIDHAVKEFERKHQPAMLQDIAKLLAQMTLGRYTGMRRRLGEENALVLDLADGSSKTPNELSTGTREQLYLAMRLAYVRHYCQQSEPLPLVMDDVLVNFDDERARCTLQALIDFSAEHQILFLTCHQGMVEMVAELLPDAKPLRLAVA
jgi:uncharacterized protein YhaN